MKRFLCILITLTIFATVSYASSNNVSYTLLYMEGDMVDTLCNFVKDQFGTSVEIFEEGNYWPEVVAYMIGSTIANYDNNFDVRTYQKWTDDENGIIIVYMDTDMSMRTPGPDTLDLLRIAFRTENDKFKLYTVNFKYKFISYDERLLDEETAKYYVFHWGKYEKTIDLLTFTVISKLVRDKFLK